MTNAAVVDSGASTSYIMAIQRELLRKRNNEADESRQRRGK